MSCHSQIWTNSPLLEPVRESYRTGKPIIWNKVNAVPDFVYFNHSIHVNRGINCNYCHGDIQKQMITYKGKPFFMSWCLDCHRHPEKFVRPREEVFGLYQKYQRYKRTSGPTRDWTAHEQNLANGLPYAPAEDQDTVGPMLIKQYHVKTEQLADCWICHR